ncbi:MAG: export ABC transporter ATP-binding protein, partial [Deinococcales bacterium]|nr:export ABC transporter ATP-binding protein [Deinococcales bacterium]
ALEALPGAASVVAGEDGVRIARSAQLPLVEVLRAAEAAGASVTNLSVSTASLEDVFLHLTGRTLRD